MIDARLASDDSGIFDVVIVGYGPTGMTLASLLGQRGHKVAVVEKWPNLYGKPRLTHMDGETARLVSLAADGDHALRDSWTTPHYYWLNGKGQLLMDVSHNERRMLWDDHISVHQPHIEEAIDERIATLPNVHLFRGYLATALDQDFHFVQLTCRRWHKAPSRVASDNEPLALRARYLVGADGANSFVRQAVGVERIDFGFEERWLCVDTAPLVPLPDKFNENAVQVCDPRRGYMFMPIGRQRQRFEFALLPHESTESMQAPEAAFRLLKEYHDIDAANVDLVRNLVYRFECRMARRWKVGRIFLAGDSAHTTPPYLGQGACSGMRDASNLAWKLELVLRGVAAESLLDSYEIERLPHARQIMLASRSLGMIANTANPLKAKLRDLMFRFKLASPPKFPVLTDGVLARKPNGRLLRDAGTLPGQGRLTVQGTTMRFDEHVGFCFAVVGRAGLEAAIPGHLRQTLRDLRIRLVELDPVSGVEDTDGFYARTLDAHNADALVLRPDFVLYGHARLAGLPALVSTLLADLQCRG